MNKLGVGRKTGYLHIQKEFPAKHLPITNEKINLGDTPSIR